jgi:hypothetical protein
VFNATFNNISAISLRIVLLVEKIGVPGENRRLAANYILFFLFSLGRRGRDRVIVGFTTNHAPMQSVPITTNIGDLP